MRKLTIGIASYGSPDKLAATIDSIVRNTRSEFKLLVIDNPTPDSQRCGAVAVDAGMRFALSNFEFRKLGNNIGYAGAVNLILSGADADYIAYCDNDIEIRTPGWDEKLCEVLDANPECGWVFPGAGHYGFNNGKYHECLWSAGYCWVMRRSAAKKLIYEPRHDYFDTTLGHHEEVDFMIRMRLAGYTIGCRPDVDVLHHESSTKSPESVKRIHRGVVTWMAKWNKYFVGDAIKYPNPDPDSGETYDPRTLRYTRWPPCALYMERWTLAQFPEINKNPRVVMTSVGEMDAITVLREKGYYHERSI